MYLLEILVDNFQKELGGNTNQSTFLRKCVGAKAHSGPGIPEYLGLSYLGSMGHQNILNCQQDTMVILSVH